MPASELVKSEMTVRIVVDRIFKLEEVLEAEEVQTVTEVGEGGRCNSESSAIPALTLIYLRVR